MTRDAGTGDRSGDGRRLPVLAKPQDGGCGCRADGPCGCHGGGATGDGADAGERAATASAGPHPPAYWRSLEERATGDPTTTPEFPAGADEAPSGWSRREFVKLLGASAALAGLQACERPAGAVLPYIDRPPELVPGVLLEYATTMTLDGYGFGLLAESREGRPIKVEGNPDHPASLGATGVWEQASILQLYDPHRGRMIRQGRRSRSWDHLTRLIGQAGEAAAASDEGPPLGADAGRGLRFLLPPTASPFRIHWIQAVQRRFPEATFTFFAPAASTSDLDGTRRLFGRPLAPLPDLEAAEVVVALDHDVLDDGPFRVRHARQFARRRRIREPSDSMNRLYSAAPLPSPTSATADHHLPATMAEIEALAAWLVRLVEDPSARPDGLRDRAAAWIRAAARDLRERPGRGLVLAGPTQSPEVHALAHLANARLGNVGRTVRFIEPQLYQAGTDAHRIEPLVEEMRAGRVRTLVVLEANPVYSAPADLDFAGALERVPRTICLGMHENETAERCEWYVPAAHYLERWGDARAYDGTLSTVQPLIAPLHDGRSADELLMAFAGQATRPAHERLREVWRDELFPGSGGDFESFWQASLRRGVVLDSAAPTVDARPTATAAALTEALRRRRPAAPPDVAKAGESASPASASPEVASSEVASSGLGREDGIRLGPSLGSLEVGIRPDPRVYDGRFANNAWLMELPDPVTKLTWENAALVAPATAARLGLETGAVVRIESGDRSLEIPILVTPGHAAEALTLRLGYGRGGAEETARGRGVSAYRLRTSESPHRVRDARVYPILTEAGPKRVQLATTQTHWSMEGREIVLEHTLEEYRREPEFTERHKGPVPTLYDGPALSGEQQWAMTIDLSICTGCSACVVACQAENNIPVVGKRGVATSREMHWIRIDRYLTGSPDEPRVVHQPMLCQHCEKAPCEYVCPVNATVHSEDGLNEMVYNRCVGTRFCSNNCAWKVRRFNWFDYNDGREAPETLVLNPDVTVRERGVMEKCTYCVQRIRRAEREARIDGRPLRPNEVRTACQQACPTEAIVFGSLTQPESDLARTRKKPRRYAVLHELGTKPRTQYLARITNPNEALHEPRSEDAPPPPEPDERPAGGPAGAS